MDCEGMHANDVQKLSTISPDKTLVLSQTDWKRVCSSSNVLEGYWRPPQDQSGGYVEPVNV